MVVLPHAVENLTDVKDPSVHHSMSYDVGSCSDSLSDIVDPKVFGINQEKQSKCFGLGKFF
jgi:hypothetical protein